jgi:hypothetical protein
MLSCYRIGDIIIQGVNDASLNSDILLEHPNTIGSDYILTQNKMDRIGITTQIVLNHLQKYNHLFPQDIIDSTVVHLRLGDAVGGHHFYEKRLRPLDVSYYQMVIPHGKVYVIGKCHFGKGDSSTNYDECRELSNKYMSTILNTLGAKHFDGGHPDIDLCFAIKSKHFVQGRGFYSQLIVEIRRRLGLKSIETQSHIFN